MRLADGTAQLEVFDEEGTLKGAVTGGDSIDAAPAMVPGTASSVVFQSSGVARHPSQGHVAAIAHATLCRLDYRSGQMETLADEKIQLTGHVQSLEARVAELSKQLAESAAKSSKEKDEEIQRLESAQEQLVTQPGLAQLGLDPAQGLADRAGVTRSHAEQRGGVVLQAHER